MTVFDSDPQLRWAFLFAHPDDELAVAGWLQTLASRGNNVQLIYATGIESRQLECNEARIHLGIEQFEVVFLDFVDGSLELSLKALSDAIAKRLHEFSPDRVAVCAFEQGHLDHDALHVATCKAWHGPLVEFPEYWPYSPAVVGINRFAKGDHGENFRLETDVFQRKIEAFDRYPSQRIRLLLRLKILCGQLRKGQPSAGQIERMRWVDRSLDWQEPNHKPGLRRVIARHPKWKRWIRALLDLEANY